MDPAEASHEDYHRIVFYRVEDLGNDDSWQSRAVRSPPCVKSWADGPPVRGLKLAYYENWQAAPNFGRALQKSNLAQLILRDHGYDKAGSFDDMWSVWWCAGQLALEALEQLHSWQRVSKFPRALALTSKLSLWRHIAAMQAKHGRAAFDFAPDSFLLPESMGAFEAHLAEQLQPGREGELWILKPDSESGKLRANSNGSGIFLHRAVSRPHGEDEILTDAVRGFHGVACKYVDKPLLMGGFKSDVRLYVLVTSFHPLVAYLYDEGLGRFATTPYDLSRSIDERTMHLTNYRCALELRGCASPGCTSPPPRRALHRPATALDVSTRCPTPTPQPQQAREQLLDRCRRSDGISVGIQMVIGCLQAADGGSARSRRYTHGMARRR